MTGVTITGLRVGYGPIEVLHGVDLVLPAGEIVAILGPNGAGKSTLLRCLAGQVPARAGTITWDGGDITTATVGERVAAGLTMVPDRDGTFASFTVADQLDLFAGGAPIEPALAAFPELEPLLERRAANLSGGERQLVALSRAVLRPGRLLLLDEVSQGLSPAATTRCYRAIGRLRAADRTIVIVEQYGHVALAAAGLVYELRRGQVAFVGEPAELTGTGGVTASTG